MILIIGYGTRRSGLFLVWFGFPGSRTEFILSGMPFFSFFRWRTSLWVPTGVTGDVLVAVLLSSHSLLCFIALQTTRPKQKTFYFVVMIMWRKNILYETNPPVILAHILYVKNTSVASEGCAAYGFICSGVDASQE